MQKGKNDRKTIKSTEAFSYFVASNSKNGFCSYYPQCFDRPEITKLYAVKGGPGTGKSHFMKEVAKERTKRGDRCEYIYCSSDPDSLDGILLTSVNGEKTAILDATAPHTYELKHPGTREEIVNLGIFWDSARLREKKDEIETLEKQKKEAYEKSYRFLSAFGSAERVRDAVLSPYIDSKALEHYAEYLLRNIQKEENYQESVALLRSVGMGGEVMLDTCFAEAEKIFLIEDCHGVGNLLMEKLYQNVRKKNLTVRVSHDPVIPEKIDGLFLEKTKISFTVAKKQDCHYPCRLLPLHRFLTLPKDPEIQTILHLAETIRKTSLQGALACFSKVRKAHFALEKIYTSTMDFSRKESFTKEFIKNQWLGETF